MRRTLAFYRNSFYRNCDFVILCLHVTAALYLVVAISMGLLYPRAMLHEGYPLFFGLCSIGVELIVLGLRYSRALAWMLGLVIFGAQMPGLFLVLAGLALWGLVKSRRSDPMLEWLAEEQLQPLVLARRCMVSAPISNATDYFRRKEEFTAWCHPRLDHSEYLGIGPSVVFHYQGFGGDQRRVWG